MAQATEDTGEPIRAAGCVLWRHAPGGGIEIGLVHRPRYDDWSHPKGKLDPDEKPAEAAVREVREETGMECLLGAELTMLRYGAQGRDKEVSYWTAEAVGGTFVPNHEVDEFRWLAPDRARGLLSYAQDRDLLDEALAVLPAGTAPADPR
ncbi:NUDIX hydrolase [Streptomyces sp. YIM 98790]|uniref:NUDIX hydrolase n=1 Tax=Streptomyces sp. YIM 98790 TaxID=2689077 RepID=UPI0028BECB26|nr:NUDIX hydrolase [Streptomyces sp. YIM 98790]